MMFEHIQRTYTVHKSIYLNYANVNCNFNHVPTLTTHEEIERTMQPKQQNVPRCDTNHTNYIKLMCS